MLNSRLSAALFRTCVGVLALALLMAGSWLGTAKAADAVASVGVADTVDAVPFEWTAGALATVLSDQTKPVLETDLPDPFLLNDQSNAYIYGTNAVYGNEWMNVPVTYRTESGGSVVVDAMPEVPSWSIVGFVWAPSVIAIPASQGGTNAGAHTGAAPTTYVMYVTTHDVASGLQCISVSTSLSPVGPFVDASAGPIVCQRALGGTIDASPFVDLDGNYWLLYKNDGNCCGITTTIWSQRLNTNGTELVGDPNPLLSAAGGWEGWLIEGPSMVVADSGFTLFYSANRWDTDLYAIGYAACDGPAGPCERVGDQPWVESGLGVAGPGGQEFVNLPRPDMYLMVMHGWDEEAVGYDEGGQRSTYLRLVRMTDDGPVFVQQ